jgi:Flp pilus assembly protein TadG
MTDRQNSPPHAGDVSPTAPDGASRGQILIMFAIMLTALLGAVGLSVDLGMAFSQRRTMQSAADAGALAGARVVSKALPSNPVSAWSEVQSVVTSNKMNVGTIASITCNYVNDAGTVLNPCTATVPTGATGVEVTVQESHPTYFIRVIPGAAQNVTTSATARANVKMLQAPLDGPFLPCAQHALLNVPGKKYADIVKQSDGVWSIDPNAIGKTFVIHGPQIERCGDSPSDYKGLADVDVNKSRTLQSPGTWLAFKSGDSAGTISADVEGADGCKANQEVINCVVFLPIVIFQTPPGGSSDKQRYAVAYVPFYITGNKSTNEHYGTILSDYIVYGKGQDGSYGWYQGYTGPMVIRLTK